MILLDTHIWVWWANNSPQLTIRHKQALVRGATEGLGVSVFSCWEVAMLGSKGRLSLGRPVEEWVRGALILPGVQLLDFSPAIAIEANYLPGEFHRDPADQILVATARIHGLPLLTEDAKILAYPHVQTL